MGSTQSNQIEGEDIVSPHWRQWAGVLAHRVYYAGRLDKEKGVVCAVWDDEDMPVDDNGIRADVIMAPNPIWNRMIPGALYEHYINATSWHVTKKIREMCAGGLTKENVEQAWSYMLKYLEIVSPPHANLLKSDAYTATHDIAIQEILTEELGLRIWYPPNNPAEPAVVVDRLHREFPIPITQVTYRGRSGRIVRTKEPVLIGSSYFMLLEKTGADFSGVASAKVQVFGIIARLTNFDKYSMPVRQQSVRLTDESTSRLFAAVIGPKPTAEILEMSNDPATHSHVAYAIYRAMKPTAIDRVIDRDVVTPGRSRANLYINHLFECQGIELVYRPDSAQPQTVHYPEEKRNMAGHTTHDEL